MTMVTSIVVLNLIKSFWQKIVFVCLQKMCINQDIQFYAHDITHKHLDNSLPILFISIMVICSTYCQVEVKRGWCDTFSHAYILRRELVTKYCLRLSRNDKPHSDSEFEPFNYEDFKYYRLTF